MEDDGDHAAEFADPLHLLGEQLALVRITTAGSPR
jgi:hypothetical protein